MSQDPYEPGPFDHYDAGEGERLPGNDREAARQRTQLPGIFLIVVACLNLLGSLLPILNAVSATLQSADELYEQQKQMITKIFPNLSKEALANKSPQDVKKQALWVNWPWAILAVLAGLLSLMGGIGLLRLRWYGLCMTGAIAAAIPCISCTGCCGVGEGVGIWALVVLLNEEVRAAFL